SVCHQTTINKIIKYTNVLIHAFTFNTIIPTPAYPVIINIRVRTRKSTVISEIFAATYTIHKILTGIRINDVVPNDQLPIIGIEPNSIGTDGMVGGKKSSILLPTI